jgi:hypothetical protein
VVVAAAAAGNSATSKPRKARSNSGLLIYAPGDKS